MNIDRQLILQLYESMLLIRQVEEHIVDVYFTDVVKSPVHLSIGQEAIAVGACDPLLLTDVISNTYRCHATYLAKGGDLNRMMAELYGKRDGCAGGKAGSMHLVDIQHGVLGASAVVGTTVPIAAGYAFALQREAEKTGRQRVVMAMFGDGATEEGAFYETLNFAAIHQLPMLFLCENNRLAIHSPLTRRWASEDICKRVTEGFGIHSQQITDGDIFAIHSAVTEAVKKLRQGEGPAFLECMTYRWLEHVGPTDDHTEQYRDPIEYEKWRKRDQIDRLANMISQEDRILIEKRVKDKINRAVQFAEQSPFPDSKELFSHVYAS